MIELEILVEAYDSEEVISNKLNMCKFIKSTHVIDIYYYDPLRHELKPDNTQKLFSSFRLRDKDKKITLTYKDDHYQNGLWLYSDEYETSVTNLDNIKIILKKLGQVELLTLDSYKRFYSYGDYEIAIEYVKKLGTFLEVELKRAIDEKDVLSEKRKIQKFIDSLQLNVSAELNAGKPELYIKKNGIRI